MAKKLGIKEQRKEFVKGAACIVNTTAKYCGSKVEVLGIDPARGSTGFALRRKSGKIITGNVTTPDLYGFSKVIKIELAIRRILKKSSPFVILEGYAMNSRWGREKAGELGGVIRRLLYFKKRPLLLVSPLTIKAWIKAKGKDQIMLEILDRYKVKISNSDAADAFVLQEIGHKALLLSKEVVASKVKTSEEVRLFLKEEEYKKEPELENLFRYQEQSLFNLLVSQGMNVEFFSKERITE